MCTLIAIHRRVRGAPLIVAANRDEYFDRPTEGPSVLPGQAGQAGERLLASGPILAPRDLRAGGTWLGINADSVFAAVTNLRNPNPDPHRRSRGMIVMDALREPTAARAADWLKTLPEETYNPFHCFVADSDRAFHVVYRDRPRIQELAPGVHVIGNVDPVEEPAPKAERIAKQVEGIAELDDPQQVLDELARVCRGHQHEDECEHEYERGGLADICVHLGQYGTRSSTLVSVGANGAVRATGTKEQTQHQVKAGAHRLLHSDGPPCENEYQDLSTLFSELSQMAGYGAEEKEKQARNGS